MKQMTLLILLISSLLYSEVASIDSFLQMEDLEMYTVKFMKIYDTGNPNPRLNTSVLIENLFAEINNLTNDLAKNNIDLKFSSQSISFSPYWEIPKQIYDDLDEILIATRNINEFFKSYYTDFLDGFYTNSTIKTFITQAIYPGSDGLYKMTALIKDNIFSHPLHKDKNNFFDRISDKLNRNFDQLCKSHSTRQQFLISFYSFIMKTQFRAFLMLSSAYNSYLEKMQPSIAKTSTEYFNCQPTYEHDYDIQYVQAIDLSPVIVDYRWNKVVTKVQLQLKNGILSLILYDGTLLENRKISTEDWDSRKHSSENRNSDGYIILKNGTFSNIKNIDEFFWKNISFLHTKVPHNHVIIGANLETLIFDPQQPLSKKLLYFRLHCAKVNTTTGKIDASNITYTKVWTKDDPELQQYPEFKESYSFRNSSRAIYDRILVNTNNSSSTIRWRRRPSLITYIDSNIINVDPLLPITELEEVQSKRGNDSTTVAGYTRRHLLVEEVPGLYIRRLTLEDPKIAREKDRLDSRSPSPVRHICHRRSGQVRPGRGSSSYRYWLDRTNKEKPAYLTITSLELPESPIPLINSQASARFRATEPSNISFEKNEILDELIENIANVGTNVGRRKGIRSAGANVTKTIDRSRKQNTDRKECNRVFTSLPNQSRTTAEGSPQRIFTNQRNVKDCICSEIAENLRINIQEQTEVNRSSRSPSPEVTHTIRIAMKYLGQPVNRNNDVESANNNVDLDKMQSNILENRQLTEKDHEFKETGCCSGVNVALDFTLNCNSSQLTSRDISLKPVTKNSESID
ncbi:uncharacterized protein [Chelonus insularis]|uniref:uncharacterized protein n=1 Tax=Chelonus insularis TaxID=460826 RepID=UPI00158A1E3A|nr:uncharacterized protein LOC118064816 [Chelonus insularis]